MKIFRLCNSAVNKRHFHHKSYQFKHHALTKNHNSKFNAVNHIIYRSHFTTNQNTKSIQTFLSCTFHQHQHYGVQQSEDLKQSGFDGITEFDPDPEIGKRATLSIVIRDYPGALAQVLSILRYSGSF